MAKDKYGEYDKKFENKPQIRGMFEERAPGGKEDKNWNAKNYGHTWSHVTPAGHVVELDDTKGSERINVYHLSGSGFEILRDGAWHVKSVGHAYNYYKGGLTESVDYGNYDFRTNNNARETVKMSIHSEAGGTRTYTSKGSTSIYAGGTITLGSDDNMAVKGKNVSIGTKSTECRITIKGETLHIEGVKNLDIQVSEDLAFHCNNFMVAAKKDIWLGQDGDFHYVDKPWKPDAKYEKQKEDWKKVRDKEKEGFG